MQENVKVFYSNITRSDKRIQNDLYELVKVNVAVPICVNNNERENSTNCFFEPKIDKQYIPKKKSRLKVKTVRDIRNLFEKDISSYLPHELEKQQSVLLRKITAGSSRNENTKTIAKNMLNGDKSISRSTWQMLTNLNPDGHTHNVQYVLWNGKTIRINGSKGGKNKFLCNYDLSKRKVCIKKESKKTIVDSKKGLLRNSLSVKFKPGPLTKKVCLDDSYQKYNVGNVELINLPKPGLEIQPTYGFTMEPRVSNFLHNLRDEDGTISKTWAELATSVLGAVRNQELVQNEGSSVTFELKYKCDQNRLLMRRDIVNNSNKISPDNDHLVSNLSTGIIEVPLEIKTVVEKLLDTVEISLQQDNLYTGVDDTRKKIRNYGFKNEVNNALVREKVVKRKYGELDRLDVTVIRLPDAPQEKNITKCSNSFCTLGCMCASLQCIYNLKDHCGRAECMFQCTCDFSKFKITDSFENNAPGLIPGLVNLNNKINFRLSKEEQKFHQTVVVSGEKSILLKSEKRNWKASKRYGKFYSNMCLKTGLKSQSILSIVDIKMNCKNIEPWCMVHNLYKCFCKGKFTENSLSSKNFEENELNETIAHDNKQCNSDVSIVSCSEKKSLKRVRSDSKDTTAKRLSISDSSNVTEIEFMSNYDDKKCARSNPYKGRKYFDSYYSTTNNKIAELEKNDETLRHRMLSLINTDKCEDRNEIQVANTVEEPHKTKKKKNDKKCNKEVKDNEKHSVTDENLTTVIEDNEKSYYIARSNALNVNKEKTDKYSSLPTQFALDSQTVTTTNVGSATVKTKLIAWIEQSYKQYKQRLDSGLVKNTLDPPKHGKVALYPWSFLLSRYKERKNLFMVSKQGPYRIFMAVDSNNEFFGNCTNIDDIRFADLHKYPLTIKNLLTNAINDLKDDFCILCGLSHCWELIGSVSKVKENETSQTESTTESNSTSGSLLMSDNEPTEHNLDDSDNEVAPTIIANEKGEKLTTNSGPENSKWFVMTVENDFSEIQFYERGFFVKYESILKAINVARLSGKTARLSAQKRIDKDRSPQFGIYAIPDSSEHCVFVGPYDANECLGIDTVRTLVDVRKNTNLTRGVWITTKTDDNMKVIENPLEFIPLKDHANETVIVSLSRDESMQNSTENSLGKASKRNVSVSEKSNISKTVKPIKIRKTDGFYHLTSKDLLKQINKPQLLQANDPLPNDVLNKSESAVLTPLYPPSSSVVTLPSLLKKSTITSRDVCPADPPPLIEIKKPVAEIAPQIKIIEVYSEANATITPVKQPERGMFILKPEEINKRLMENKLNCTTPALPIQKVEDMDQDIENFLATSAECIPPNAEIFEISDDDEGSADHNVWKDVWIECKNIDNLGLIKGRLNAKNELSFEFPGFKFTDFYSEEEAFTKINQ